MRHCCNSAVGLLLIAFRRRTKLFDAAYGRCMLPDLVVIACICQRAYMVCLLRINVSTIIIALDTTKKSNCVGMYLD